MTQTAAPDLLIAKATGLSSATLHEAAGRIGALPSVIKPADVKVTVCGRALPVKSAPGDNLWLHRAIYEAAPGDVLVVDVGDGQEFGYWGEVMAVAAQVRGIAGLVINGGTRDSQRMVEIGFPVFSAGICIRGTVKEAHAIGSVGEAITLGDVLIQRGDLVVGDADGVVVVQAGLAEAAIEKSLQRDANELELFARLRAGERTIDIYGPAPKSKG